MKNVLLVPLLAAAAMGLSAEALADCTCADAKVHTGWCSDCKVGYFDSVKIKSEKLYNAMAGQEVDGDAVKCDGCKKAMASDGRCDHCNVGFAHKKGYKSPVAYHLMRGESMDVEKVECPGCKKGTGAHPAWCDHCDAGFVGNVMFKDKGAYKEATEARKVLVKASGAKCDGCAVAMVTDGKCEACNVSYAAGKATKEAPPVVSP